MTTTTSESPLALPPDCRLLYVSGDQSGVGKSSIALSILHLLLTRRGYHASELGYIKPCTQCEDVQTIAKFCQQRGIQHVDLGPVIFYSGYTQECIDGTAPDTEAERRAKIQTAVLQLAQGKRFVVVDGVGYPAVGSVCGVSNADVAHLLSAPVLLVSRSGVGNAIDATCYMQAFFLHHHAHPIGVVYNKVPSNATAKAAHSYERTVEYTHKFFARWKPQLSVYGHVPVMGEEEKEGGEGEEEEKVCMVRGGKDGWEMSEKERARLSQWLAVCEGHIDIDRIVGDVHAHYAQQQAHGAAAHTQ